MKDLNGLKFTTAEYFCTSHNVNHTSSEVASVLEASAAATSLSWSATTAKLILASPAASTQATASFWSRASLVGFLLSRQRGLALLFVLFQQLGSLLLLHLSIDDLTEALSLLRQRVEACNGRKGKKHDSKTLASTETERPSKRFNH